MTVTERFFASLGMTPAVGLPFALNLGCPILDDFQGWGFRPVSSCALNFLIRCAQTRQSMHGKISTLQKRMGGAAEVQKLRQRLDLPRQRLKPYRFFNPYGTA
jgi:hypothetical protein